MSMSTLRPCRFCKSPNVNVPLHRKGCAHVRCKTCGAQGPTATDAIHAAVLWNSEFTVMQGNDQTGYTLSNDYVIDPSRGLVLPPPENLP